MEIPITNTSSIPVEATLFSQFKIGNATGVINADAAVIDVEVPHGTALTSLAATFAVPAGASVKVGNQAQTSGTTQNNFSSPVTYKVTGADGTTTRNWTVNVTVAAA